MKNSKIIMIAGLLIFFAFIAGVFIGRSTVDENPTVLVEEKSEDTGIININTATLDELCLLPGISEITAQKIIDYREDNGRFRYVEELCEISGISEEKLDDIKDYITV